MKPPRYISFLSIFGSVFLFFLALPNLLFAQIEPFQQQLLDKAVAHIEAEQFDEALNVLNALAEDNGISDSVVLQTAFLPPNVPKDLLAPLLLYRGMAHEGLGEFAEAKNNYLAYLSFAPTTETSNTVSAKLPILDAQATAYLARLSIENEQKFVRFYQATVDSLTLGILPFFNASRNPQLGRVGYGISGFLSATLALMPRYLQLPLRVVERGNLNAAFSELTLARFYAPDAQPKLAHILGARFVLSGTLHEQDNRIRAEAQLVDLNGRCTTHMPPVETYKNDEGIRFLQAELHEQALEALEICFKNQVRGDRFAYKQDILPLYIDKFQQLLLYGEALEASALGRIRQSNRLFTQSGIVLAQQEQQYLNQQRQLFTESSSQLPKSTRNSGTQLSQMMANTALGSSGMPEDAAMPTGDAMGAVPALLNPNLQPLLVRIKIPLPLPPR